MLPDEWWTSILCQVTLEIFLELNCEVSAAALPVVQRVADHYGNTRLNLVVQQLVLSYHRNAFLSTQVENQCFLKKAKIGYLYMKYIKLSEKEIRKYKSGVSLRGIDPKRSSLKSLIQLHSKTNTSCSIFISLNF